MPKKVKILHIIDDEKFIKYCEETFKLEGITNIYLTSSEFNKKACNKGIDLLILHYLSLEKATVINENIETPVIWFFWGNDGFLLGKFSRSFLQFKTRALYLKLGFNRNIKEGLKRGLKTLFPLISDHLHYNKQIIRAFEKIDLIVPVMPGDYDLLANKYNIKSPMFHLNYVNPSLNENVRELNSNDRNILLGNSASYSNNHIEMIDILAQQNLKDRRVIIPLSYGDKQYALYIEKYAVKVLKEKALCLMDFIPLNDYMKILKKCDIVIMNHKRQQAVGNIVPLLIQGSHIYLNEESSLYIYLKNKNFHISKINEYQELRKLNSTERLENKYLGLLYFGKESQHNKVKTLIENMVNHNNDN
jgi:dTDP-N-acetylfucosamine:lipid II N-acetylfucosaminyltransferase